MLSNAHAPKKKPKKKTEHTFLHPKDSKINLKAYFSCKQVTQTTIKHIHLKKTVKLLEKY